MKHLIRTLFAWTMFTNITLIESHFLYTDDDFEVTESLGRALGVKSYAFVEDEIHADEDMVKQLKFLSNFYFYSTFITTSQLEKILDHDSASHYFQRKTLIITKQILNFTCLLQKVSGPTLLYWLVFTDTLDTIETSYIPANADVLVVHSTYQAVVINKVYHLQPGRKLSVKNVGIWPKFEDESFVPPLLYPESIDYINFENVTLRTLVLFNKDSCNFLGKKHALDRMECFQQEMIDIMAQKLNFTISILECPEKRYPYNYPNGSLSELFLILLRREVDLSSASYVVNKNRLNNYDFAWPTFTTKSMMYLKFRLHSPNWRAYIRPMDRHLWYAVLSWIVTAGLVVEIFDILRSRNSAFHLTVISKSFKSILEALQMFCNQGVQNMPQWNSNRMVYIMTLVLVLIVYQVYSGHLISSLMVLIPQIPFMDLEGFFSNGDFRLMTLKKGFHHFYFKKILDQKGLSNLMLSSEELPLHPSESVVKLCSDDHLALVEFRENIVQEEFPCKIIEIPRPMLYQNIGMGFPKNSPYQEFIKRELTLLQSTGILQRMRRHLFSYKTLEEKDTSVEDFVPVTIKQVSSIFILHGVGVLISCILFLMEFFYYYIAQQILRKKSELMSKENKRSIRLKMILSRQLIKYK